MKPDGMTEHASPGAGRKLWARSQPLAQTKARLPESAKEQSDAAHGWRNVWLVPADKSVWVHDLAADVLHVHELGDGYDSLSQQFLETYLLEAAKT